MKQLFSWLLVSILSEMCRSMEAAESQYSLTDAIPSSFCYNSGSGKSCFTTFHDSTNHPVRKSFEEASDYCKRHVPGSSLIVVNGIESQGIVRDFIGRQLLANETIILDARKLSNGNSLRWSWVNGHQTIPTDVERYGQGHDGACVTSVDGLSLVYCTDDGKSKYPYICSDANVKSVLFSFKHNNKTYVLREPASTWYDARKNCLNVGGDLASITDLQTIKKWLPLKENQTQRYWIGLHRNRWFWNSTGAALTYTNWENDGFPEESSDKQCICINRQCKRTTSGHSICNEHKWRTCDCNQNYAIVCQKEETYDILTTTNMVTERMLQSTVTTRRQPTTRSTPTTTATSTSTTISTVTRTTPTTTTTSTQTPTATSPIPSTISAIVSATPQLNWKTISTSAMDQKPSTHFSENQTTAVAPSSTGLFQSFTITELLLVLFLFVTVVLIVFVVIFFIRKCKKARRNEESPLNKIDQNASISAEYETMAGDRKRPPGDSVPIYTELELTQRPMTSSSIVYANVQPTIRKAVDMDVNVIYEDPRKV